jgi:fatty acid desaturase
VTFISLRFASLSLQFPIPVAICSKGDVFVLRLLPTPSTIGILFSATFDWLAIIAKHDDDDGEGQREGPSLTTTGTPKAFRIIIYCKP